MKISSVKTQLSSEDLKSIVFEFVKVDGLTIEDIQLNNCIKIDGVLEKNIKIKFSATIEIISVIDGVVKGKFAELRLFNFGFFRPIRSLALKLALKQIEMQGIKIDKDTLEIDTQKIINTIPFFDLKIEDIYTSGQKLNIEVKDIEISLVGGLIKENEVIEEVKERKDDLILPIKKTEDIYSEGRTKIKTKMTGKVKKASEYILLIPDIVALIYRLLKDSRVPVKTKLSIAASVSFIVFPIDFIPDKIPFIGRVDDVAVMFFALNKIITDIPINVILENWSGKNELVFVLKNGIEFISDFTGAGNVEKLYNAIEEIGKL